MKKYLMMALAVLALASCTKNDVATMSQADINKAKYDQAFLRMLGAPIAAGQDWGFSSTRGLFATRGSYPNGNMWEAEGWRVPPELTDGQKERVYKYFQCHTGLRYNDPGFTNYWIQQVYKGGTDANNSYSETAEKYQSANNGWVVGSDHMDHLEAVLSDGTHEHIFNFNYGNCTDWGGRMLMVNSGTHLFGYFNSDGSLGHTNYTGLVNWKTIEEWGEEKGVGETLNDGWERSFMGFDFEQVVGDDIYAKDGNNFKYATYEGPATDGRIWDGQKVTSTISGYDSNWQPVFVEGYENMKYNGKLVHLLKSDQNEYCGDFIEYTSDDDITINIDGYGKCLNMKKINEDLLSQGYLPVAGGSLKKWVKVHGGADGYFSDWIVTLIEAETIPEGDLRILGEDISAQQDGDFDFNDIVLDVTYGSPAKIKLVAAGGTLPLYINVQDDAHEIHHIFAAANPDKDITVKTMINTHATAEGEYGAVDGLETVDITNLLNVSIADAEEANEKLTLFALKDGEIQELTAPKNEPTCKLAVDPSYRILKERQSIKKHYELFVDWATETGFVSKWWQSFKL